VYEAELRGLKIKVILVLLEHKNELGDGRCDPSRPAGLSFTRFAAQDDYYLVGNNSCCPTFLVATAGAWLAVLGLDTPFAEARCRQMARTMYALRRNIERLEKCYEALDLHPDAHEYLHPSVFPSITMFLDKTGNTTPFKYVRPLEDEPRCVAFHAKTIGSSPMDVVIKFVERYGEEAHQLLAKEHLAPQLLYCGRVGVHDDDPTFENFAWS